MADKCHILHVHYLFYVYVDHWVDQFWSIFMWTARQSVNEIAFSLSLSLSLCEIQCTSENPYLRGSLPNSQDSSPLNKGFHRYSIMDMIDLWYKLQRMFSPLEQHSCGKSPPFVWNDVWFSARLCRRIGLVVGIGQFGGNRSSLIMQAYIILCFGISPSRALHQKSVVSTHFECQQTFFVTIPYLNCVWY